VAQAAQAAQPAASTGEAASPGEAAAAAAPPDAAPLRDMAVDIQAMIGALSALATAQTAAQLRQALTHPNPNPTTRTL